MTADPDRPRVFGIGLNKTATTSLHRALCELGYESLHWGGPPIRERVEEAAAAGEPLLSRMDPAIDAFSDIEALSMAFATLDRQYPGSRFILTVRPVDEWIDSRRRHVENNQAKRARGEYSGNFLVVDETAWRVQWDRHLGAVREYFAGRDDLLEIDLTDAPRWEPLCGFLSRPVPDAPFPWVNQGAAR